MYTIYFYDMAYPKIYEITFFKSPTHLNPAGKPTKTIPGKIHLTLTKILL